MSFTCLFPDALNIEPSTALPIKRQAERLFARYRQILCFDDEAAVPLEMPWEKWLRQQFVIADAASLEASTAFADQAPMPCWRLTPVHLHLGRDHVVLSDPGQLKLDLGEARALHESIAPLLHESGLQLLIEQPDRWYLRTIAAASDHFAGLIAHGWRAANGRNIDAYNPSGNDVRQWRRLLNEVQMTWHEHPVNEDRALRGLPAVNSLWFDGLAGAAQAAPFERCYSDLYPLRGLIRSLPEQPVKRRPSSAKRAGVADRVERVDCEDIKDIKDINSLGDFKIYSSSGFSKTTGGSVLIAVDPLNLVVPDGEYRSLTLWRMIETLVSELKGDVRVVLTGERRLVELERKGIGHWAFWRQTKTEDWFEWTNRDH